MDIKGLTIIPDYITETEETNLLTLIYESEWNNTLRRRTQHYGYEYNYTCKSVFPTKSIPLWMNNIQTRVSNTSKYTYDQIIVNEYTCGQGISKHIDSPKIFGDIISCLSLGGDCDFVFSKCNEMFKIRLLRKTLVIMSEDCRYNWCHEIPARRKNITKTRVSITWRKLL